MDGANPDELEALDVARDLARHGVPIFLAKPAAAQGKWDPAGGHNGCGYWLPDGWHLTTPDPAVVDAWKPGMALCAVGGHAVDFLDVDPRNGGDQSAKQLRAAALWPVTIGEAATPSGGTHHLVNVLRVRSRDNVLPGLDVKAGHAEGRVKGDGTPDDGRGFVFLAPTRKRSKSSGRVGRYVWTTPPVLEELDPADPSVEPLRDLVEQARGRSGTSTPADTPHAAWDALDASQRARVERWLRSAVEGERVHLADVATWPEGRTDERGRGWEKLVSDVAHRFGALARADWTPWTLEDGHRAFLDVVPPALLVAVPDKWEQQSGRGAPTAWPSTLDGDPLADFRSAPTSSTASPTSSTATAAAEDEDEDGGPRRSVAAQLVDLALERYRFTATPDGEPFAIPLPGTPTGNGHVVRMLRGGRQSLRSELASVYRAKTGRVASQQALADALRALEGDAQAAEPESVHVRVAAHEGAIFLDVGDSLERVVRVSGGRWDLVESGVPVLFKRTQLTGTLPTPVPGGGIERLWDLLNVSPEDRGLVLAWLVSAIVTPDVPHPVLAVFGEQGSGKSSASRLLVALVDPSPVALRKPPRDMDSWVTAAQGSWVVGLDNLSTVPDWLSDSLCRAVTGEGDVRRQLYSDSELSVFAFRRCVLLNGIELGAIRGDLADRLVTVDLDRIPEDRRRTEHEMDREWRDSYPLIFGGLLDLAAGVAQLLPSVRLDTHPRMADFAAVAAAVDQLVGTRALDRFLEKSRTLAEDSLTADPFVAEMATALAGDEFEGTAAELLARVTPTTDGWRRPADWPKSPQQVSGRLRRNAPALRTSGWTVEDDGARNKKGTKLWRLTAPTQEEIGRESSPPSPPPRLRRSEPQNLAGMASQASPPIPAASPPLAGSIPAASPPIPAIPATGEPLTSRDGEAGKAGMDSVLSRARDLPRCVDCGGPVHPLAGGKRCVPCQQRQEQEGAA